jgi:hypothetical protein
VQARVGERELRQEGSELAGGEHTAVCTRPGTDRVTACAPRDFRDEPDNPIVRRITPRMIKEIWSFVVMLQIKPE